MGKQKQQVISRFFAPKPKPPSSTTDPPPPSPSPRPTPSTPKISTTVSFSPAKRRLISQLTSSPNKQPKLSVPSPPNPSLHQRFLQKLLEPSPPDPHLPSSSQPVKFTPLEEQVVELKAKYPDVLLMIEVGYKYRFFGQDAETAARVLGIYAHMNHNFLTASIPTVRLHVHVRRLVSAGYKVGVVKQTETASIKAHGLNRGGPFCRGLSALYTKATLEAAQDLGGGEDECGSVSNYLLCVVEKSISGERKSKGGVEGGFDVRIGIVGVEISTGDVVYGEFNDNFLRSELEAVVVSLSPAELLLGDPLSKQTEKLLLAFAGPSSNARVERASRDCFTDGGALAEVMTLYENMCVDSSSDSMQGNELTEHKTQQMEVKEAMNLPDLAVEALALTIRHLKGFGFERILCSGALRPFANNTEMTLSANALLQLEVLQNNSDGSDSGSLLQTMNHTLTIFGSRLLRHWVTHPLCDQTTISARLNAVSEIAESMGTCNGMKNLGCSEEDPDVTIVQPELANILSLVLKALGRAPDIQRGITRIFHCTATPSELSSDVKVPSNWVKINSTKKTIRYHPPEVVTALDELSLAKEKLTVACRAAWDSFLRDFSKHYAEFQASVQALAALDCLHSLATLSRNKGYVRPGFVDDDEPVQIQFCSGRHPVLETTLQNNFVPNDTKLHADREYCQIVTGPNMGGKSCYVRQVALITLMAQVGSYVPASSAKLHVLDGIYTRMGASDSIQLGRSTFLEELSETSHILHRCTERSLVILDELGRGTSTHDGMAIAYATLHYLLKQKKSLVLFVTHYPKIASLETEFPGSVAAYHMSHMTANDDSSKNSNDHEDVTYLYKLIPGVSERSFGFKVAHLAQLPPYCIRRGIVMASELESLVNSRLHGRSGNELLLEAPVIDQEQEPHDCPRQDFDSAFKEFYSNLKAAILDDDNAKSFQLLESARSIAKTLVSRSMQLV
ncbi:DNA mismatch repair protein MSH3-like isoform X2 [Vicia villosa]|uniref:DNA mismatch repair protein MSH3-like isoform X2 n=1 Tax=Vicia villosa TaxID=3911 RepID=UPI00273B703B|nr:DNA mismatch repair protein MSH3-like isoform X2 [Vicia villosa]